jgi:Polymerase beta, Nucleotidyltransferase
VSASSGSPEALCARVTAKHPGLPLLVLFGSRARRDARDDSDWDLGYLANPGLDADALLLDPMPTITSTWCASIAPLAKVRETSRRSWPY